MNARKLTVPLSAAAVLVACSGGTQVAGIDGRGAVPPPPPVATNVVSVGTITSFGSIFVNGVRYELNGAAITVDGNPGTQADLAVGQVVAVRGTLSSDGTTGTATSVHFNSLLEGPVVSIDVTAGTLVVLGQVVRIDAATSFDDSIVPGSIEGINVGDPLEISGFFLADGTISATRVERQSVVGELEVNGLVSNVTATTFSIGSLVVDYSSAMLDDFPNGAPEDGQAVEARGNMLGGSGELVATVVEFKGNEFADDDADQVELEGFITRFSSDTDFDVEGIPVTSNAQTQYENGTSADLGLNRKVEVEGDFDATGVLVADKIELKPSGTVRVESLVEDVQGNQLTVLGLSIEVNSSTRLEDQSDADLEPFAVTDINVGDYVEIRGFEDSGGIVATLLEREGFDGEVALRGFVESIADPNFSILGVTIETGGGTQFQDLNDQPISAADFFPQATGSLVEASGTLNNGVIVAEEVELED